LRAEFDQPYMHQLREFLRSERAAGKEIYPPGPLIFNALNSTPLERVKVVILGRWNKFHLWHIRLSCMIGAGILARRTLRMALVCLSMAQPAIASVVRTCWPARSRDAVAGGYSNAIRQTRAILRLPTAWTRH